MLECCSFCESPVYCWWQKWRRLKFLSSSTCRLRTRLNTFLKLTWSKEWSFLYSPHWIGEWALWHHFHTLTTTSISSKSAAFKCDLLSQVTEVILATVQGAFFFHFLSQYLFPSVFFFSFFVWFPQWFPLHLMISFVFDLSSCLTVVIDAQSVWCFRFLQSPMVDRQEKVLQQEWWGKKINSRRCFCLHQTFLGRAKEKRKRDTTLKPSLSSSLLLSISFKICIWFSDALQEEIFLCWSNAWNSMANYFFQLKGYTMICDDTH